MMVTDLNNAIQKAKKKKKPVKVPRSFRFTLETNDALAKLAKYHNVKEPFIVNQLILAAAKGIEGKTQPKENQEDKVS